MSTLSHSSNILSRAREAGSPLKAAARARQEGHPRTLYDMIYSTSGKTDGILLRQGGSGTPQYFSIVFTPFHATLFLLCNSHGVLGLCWLFHQYIFCDIFQNTEL